MQDTAHTLTPQQAIARMAGEPPKAYGAFVQYAQMGARRSLAKLAAVEGRSRANLGQRELWSVRWEWQRRVTGYDDALAAEAAQAHVEHYRAELEEHRKRYGDVGKALYSVSLHLLKKLNAQKDELALTPATLGVLLRAFLVAGDLEAHALGIERLLVAVEHGQEQQNG